MLPFSFVVDRFLQKNAGFVLLSEDYIEPAENDEEVHTLLVMENEARPEGRTNDKKEGQVCAKPLQNLPKELA